MDILWSREVGGLVLVVGWGLKGKMGFRGGIYVVGDF
jgi:hypothetical protein